MLEKDIIKLRHFNTMDNIVDLFTKGVVETHFFKLRSLLVSPLSIKGENVENLVLGSTSNFEFSMIFSLCIEM